MDSYSIIKKHGGHIKVESKLGVGTTFFIYLPTSQGKIQSLSDEKNQLCFGQGKILFMAPTKPLCVQHHKTLSEFFEGETTVLTGAIPPTDRKALWKDSKIIC